MWSYVYLFFLSAGQLINSLTGAVPGYCAFTWFCVPDTEVICHLSMNHWWHKDPCDNKLKIYANQLPLFYASVVVNVVNVCEIKWFESSFQCPYNFDCLYVTSWFVVWILLTVLTCLFDSMLMFMLECITTKETLGNSFINTEHKIEWLTKLVSFCSFSSVTLPHISKHCTSM